MHPAQFLQHIGISLMVCLHWQGGSFGVSIKMQTAIISFCISMTSLSVYSIAYLVFNCKESFYLKYAFLRCFLSLVLPHINFSIYSSPRASQSLLEGYKRANSPGIVYFCPLVKGSFLQNQVCLFLKKCFSSKLSLFFLKKNG